MAETVQKTPQGISGLLEGIWTGWRGKPKVKGNTEQFLMGFRTQRHWDWKIAIYLYGAGTGAGLIFLEVLFRNLDLIDSTTALWGMWIGLAITLVALTFLFDHLGRRARWKFWYAIRNPKTSWISRGFFIVAVLVVLRIIVLWLAVAGQEGSATDSILRGAVMVFALAFMAYSGLVLSSWNSIAFWNTPLLPVLYVGYSFMGGLAALPIFALLTGGVDGMLELGDTVWPWLLGLLLGNGAGLLLYVWGMATSIVAARESARRLLRGEQGLGFWLGIVGVGLVLPAVILALALWGALGEGTGAAAILVVAMAAILVGGYILRDHVLRVGVYGPPV